MTDVAIIGNGVSGNLLAMFIRKKLPRLDVTVVGKADPHRPIVGESTVESSTHFLRELGLHQTLVETHFPKYGLTYYYKANLSDPNDRRYVVDEAPAIPPLPSFQLNRFVFDVQLQERNRELGVDFVAEQVKDIELGTNGQRHRVLLQDGSSIDARFVIDATGRRRLLGRKLNLHEKTNPQRTAFWFRLVDFDADFLDKMKAIKKRNDSYDSYYATHHFFGHGNWVWAIPMRTSDHRNMISIGITYRPDIYEGDACTLEAFMERVGREHPVLTEMIQSGKVLETSLYRNYMYRARKRYSSDGWFLIGDAANAVDPLYSSGLVVVSVQARQITELLRRQVDGTCTDEIVSDFDDAFDCFYSSSQNEVSQLYEVMHHPWKCHMRQHLTVLSAFHLGVPLISLDYITDPVGAKLFAKIGRPESIKKELGSLRELIDKVGDRMQSFDAADYMKVQSAFTMNWDFFEYTREEDLPSSISSMLSHLTKLRLSLIRKLGVKEVLRPQQSSDMASHMARAFALETLLRGKRLREHPVVRWYLGAR